MKKIFLLSSFIIALFMFCSSVYAATTITSITIKTPPTKITYVAGDKLDLTGLVVTLVKSDQSSEDVALANFATKDITTVKANDSLLSFGDKKVTIKADLKRVVLAITVGINISCVNTATSARETAVISSATTFATSIGTALTARKEALTSAWSELDATKRSTAIKTAWNSFLTTQTAARSAYSTEIKSAWATWKKAAKNCGLASFTETQGLDLRF